MGDLIKFPMPEPEPERPGVGYCMSCGTEVLWPPPMVRWPDSCPQGCSPLMIQSWKPEVTYTWLSGGDKP